MARIYSLGELANFLQAEVVGDTSAMIVGVCSLEAPRADCICFLQDYAKYAACLQECTARAVIIKRGESNAMLPIKNALLVDDPYVAYAKISALFTTAPQVAAPGIHSTAIIGEGCEIASDVAIGPYVVIGNHVKIASGVKIAAGCRISDQVSIGKNSCLCSNVVIYHQVQIGTDVLIHAGAVIGADGFGNANEHGTWHKIHQLGRVIIGDDVEIGANTTIDRGAIDDTIIGSNVRIDNLVQIAHNVQIGDHSAIAGCVGIAGSTKIGRYCLIGGHAGINGHITITDQVIIAGMSSVAKSITQPGMYASSIPAVPHLTWWRTLSQLLKLDKLMQRLKNLEKKVNDL